MTLAVTAGGTGASNTSTATLAFNCGLTVAVGDLIVVIAGNDNAGSGGARSLTSITTGVGNTFTFQIDALRDPGAANAGAQLVIATSVATASMTSTDQITCNYSPNTTAKSAQAYKVTKDAANDWSIPLAGTTSTQANTANPTITTSANVIVADMVVAGVGAESTAAGTGDADTTNGTWSALVSTASGGTMRTYSQYKVQTTADSTQAFTLTLAAADHAVGILVLGERSRDRGRLPSPHLQAVTRAGSW